MATQAPFAKMAPRSNINTDKTSLKADKEVGGRGDEPHRWNKRRGGQRHRGVQTELCTQDVGCYNFLKIVHEAFTRLSQSAYKAVRRIVQGF